MQPDWMLNVIIPSRFSFMPLCMDFHENFLGKGMTFKFPVQNLAMLFEK